MQNIQVCCRYSVSQMEDCAFCTPKHCPILRINHIVRTHSDMCLEEEDEQEEDVGEKQEFPSFPVRSLTQDESHCQS